MRMFYKKDFGCRASDPLQRQLNELYKYDTDLSTKVMHRARLNLFSDLMEYLLAEGYLSKLSSAIDIGCNAGMYSKIISDMGYQQVLGIDIDPSGVVTAKAAFGSETQGRKIEFRVQNAEGLADSESSQLYDFLLCTEVIEHTQNPKRVLDAIGSILRPGGIAVISLPNGMSPPYLYSYLSQKIQGKEISSDLRDHLSYPSYNALRLLRATGLKIIKTTGTNLMPDPMLRILYNTPAFTTINRANQWVSAVWPIKYVAQFFFVAMQRPI